MVAESSRALAMGKIADIHDQRGEYDEALCIRREEQLVVYERLGDIRSRPVCIGRRQQWPPAAIQLVANWLLPSADESITS